MTSTVETQNLTATVTTTEVDGRTLTAQRARQLDEIPLDRLDIFGRVKIGDSGHFVLGRDRDTGVLSLARYSSSGPGGSARLPIVRPSAFPDGEVWVCDGIRGWEPECIDRLEFRFSHRGDPSFRSCEVADHWHPASRRCEPLWGASPEAMDRIRDVVTAWHRDVAPLHAAAEAAPLIVLGR